MKVTALIPDKLVKDVKSLSKGKTITESLIKAISEWTALERIKQLNNRISSKPLEFSNNYSAEKIRKINRQK